MKIKNTKPLDFSKGGNGTISGYFSIFAKRVSPGVYEGEVDSYGDIVDPHCFDNTIKEHKASGKPFPLLFNHDFNQIIGRVNEIKPDSKGAFFSADFFPTDRAQEIRAICAADVIYQFSWAYDVVRQEKVKLTNGKTANCLMDVKLYEVTITGTPAEPRSQMTDIKSGKPTKEELLNYCAGLKAEQDTAKWELLRTINGMNRLDRAAKLEKLKDMEARAIADIALAEKNNNRTWKAQRVTALEAIRAQIDALKRANS